MRLGLINASHVKEVVTQMQHIGGILNGIMVIITISKAPTQQRQTM